MTGHPGVKAATVLLDRQQKNTYLKGLHGSAASLVTVSLFEKSGRNMLCILEDPEDAGYFYHDCCQALTDRQVLFFPSGYKRHIRYGQVDAANEILRTEALEQLSDPRLTHLIITYPQALAEKVVSKTALRKKTLKLAVSEKVDSLWIAEVLETYGFERVDYVYEPGQYAVRGSIIDVFSYSNEYPYRIDFFGDEVESIRSFDVETQLSKQKLESIDIVSANAGDADTCLLSYLQPTDLLLFRNEPRVYEKVHAVLHENPVLTGNSEMLQSPEQLLSVIVTDEQLCALTTDFCKIHLGAPVGLTEKAASQAVVEFSTEIQPSFHKNFDLVTQTFKERIRDGFRLYVLSDNEKQIARIRSIFEDRGDVIPFTPILKTLHEGFVDHRLKVSLYTDHQLFDRFHKFNLKSDRARSGKIALSLKELQQFQIGDYVVHIDHGIGRFQGLVRTEINGKMQEVIKLSFQNNDFIFVSIHSLHKIAKYKGKEGEPPRLNKLGSGVWENLKNRTKKKVKDIAHDLILLYSKRLQEKGFAFSPDTYLQKELEASFIYEDTPDQEKATNDIKQDMENTRPMDRLVCGDVGFGKTEVAIRASFKAVTDGKQVAVLVPTTILAYQHYHTFKERLADFPCSVDYLSRARKPADVKAMLAKLKDGKIDILIGTHKLIGKDVAFKDLGLLIIDEEQKFGVSVKEKLKQMKVNVDTLTLTATPIPRTLQFSLMGARDLSSLTTPPPNRYPIQTEVHRFDSDIFREAINFEMSRNGQILIINDRVKTIFELKKRIHKEVPDARIAVGHGQLEPAQMEQVIMDFINYEYDVLIATTIIENGIDIPNANTIIVNNAHHYGLSDLHQLRGRVGRSNKKAFCYLLAPPLHQLTPEARRRLQAIENFAELGSGIHIAMQDLDIRGAGNLLGAEQSGFIADLGYETYQRILAEAVQELKNESFAGLYKNADAVDSGDSYVLETNIECDMEVLFPASYIPNDSERIAIYRELDHIETEDNIQRFVKNLEDRFGKIPPQGEELINIVRLKRLGKKLGIEKISLKSGMMNIFLVANPDSAYYQSEAFDKLLKFVGVHYRQCQLKETAKRRSLLIRDILSVMTACLTLEEINTMIP
ncbi:MAG: transcription-repair coupling factor [Dysgonamonadaceae bacterium]|nr:transcription-repair coupling factor [Dysgonamonadaceae bacterium]